MPSGVLHRVAVVRIDVSNTISPPSSVFFRVIALHSFVTVEGLLISPHRGILCRAEEHCLLEPHGIIPPEGICHCYGRQNIPEDVAPRPYILYLYGDANQQWFHGNTTLESYHPAEPWRWTRYIVRNVSSNYSQTKQTPWLLVRKRTTPTERPPFVGEF
jgi:hypothetical protein